MEASQKVFDHLRYNKLPINYTVKDGLILIDCKGWDINEIDDLIMVVGGKRKEFIVEVPVETNNN